MIFKPPTNSLVTLYTPVCIYTKVGDSTASVIWHSFITMQDSCCSCTEPQNSTYEYKDVKFPAIDGIGIGRVLP